MVKAAVFRLISIAVALSAMHPDNACAFEADVHFGLTHWLALRAGYSPQQARTIARGNQQADSGVMDSILPMLEYACVARSPRLARAAQSYHFAAAATAPAAPERRQIVANGEPVHARLDTLMKAARGNADSHLLKLGEALHLLQDSWAYQGIPDQPVFQTAPVVCDAALSSATPRARGGWNSHKGDIASQWPDDTKAMAAATYQHLTAYPVLSSGPRVAEAWPAVSKELDGFLQASTKAAQRRWFLAHGVDDVSFLRGISLADGTVSPVVKTAMPRAIPPLRGVVTAQHTATPEVKAFFDAFFARWLMSSKPESALGKSIMPGQRDLAARLKLWRMQDHGQVAALAHAEGALTESQLQKVNDLTRLPDAYAAYGSLAEAVFPLLEDTPRPSPLLPFIIHALPDSKAGNERAIAVAKLRHVPYDELGVIAERDGGQWRVVDLIAVVSH